MTTTVCPRTVSSRPPSRLARSSAVVARLIWTMPTRQVSSRARGLRSDAITSPETPSGRLVTSVGVPAARRAAQPSRTASGVRLSASTSITSTAVADSGTHFSQSRGGPAAAYGSRYVFAQIDQSTFVTRLRANYTIGPDLTLELYGEPFAASG